MRIGEFVDHVCAALAIAGLFMFALVLLAIVWSIPLAIAIGILKLCGVF